LSPLIECFIIYPFYDAAASKTTGKKLVFRKNKKCFRFKGKQFMEIFKKD